MTPRFPFWKNEVSHKSIYVYIEPYSKKEDTGKVSVEGIGLELTLKHTDDEHWEVRVWESELMEKANDNL